MVTMVTKPSQVLSLDLHNYLTSIQFNSIENLSQSIIDVVIVFFLSIFIPSPFTYHLCAIIRLIWFSVGEYTLKKVGWGISPEISQNCVTKENYDPFIYPKK